VGVPPQLAQFALIMASIAALTLVLFLYVLPNSQINAAHTKIAQLQEQQANLQRQNAEVLQAIARYSDLKTLEIRAQQLGMQPVQSAIYLTLPIIETQLAESLATSPANADTRSHRSDPPDKPALAGPIRQQAEQLLDRTTTWVNRTLARLLGD
jgi:hypothetical protein